VRPGDRLLSLAGRPVADTGRLLNAVALLKPGARVPITVLRDDQRHELQVTVGRRPTPPPP
jgi:serine protease DegQ